MTNFVEDWVHSEAFTLILVRIFKNFVSDYEIVRSSKYIQQIANWLRVTVSMVRYRVFWIIEVSG